MDTPATLPGSRTVRLSDIRSSSLRSSRNAPLSPAPFGWDGVRRSSPGVLDWRGIVDLRIEAYRPRSAGPGWDRVADEVRRVVRRALPQTPYTAVQLLGPAAKLALYADGLGRPADAALWLDLEMIEQFVQAHRPVMAGSTLGNYRSRLLRLREAHITLALPGGDPARLPGSEASAPYRREEVAALWSWARGQSTEAMRQGLRTLLALGLGCGLDSGEIVPLRAHDVRVLSDGRVVVHVRGRRARAVLCRRRWERVLAEAVERVPAGGWLFRPEAAARTKNTVVNFIDRAKPSLSAPRLVMGRARAAWIVELVDAGTPITVLVAAAGIESLHALSRFMPHFATLEPDAAAAWLRGPA